MQTDSISSAKQTSDQCCYSVKPLTSTTTSGPFNTWDDAGVSPVHVRPSASSHAHLLSIFTPSLSCRTVFLCSLMSKSSSSSPVLQHTLLCLHSSLLYTSPICKVCYSYFILPWSTHSDQTNHNSALTRSVPQYRKH